MVAVSTSSFTFFVFLAVVVVFFLVDVALGFFVVAKLAIYGLVRKNY